MLNERICYHLFCLTCLLFLTIGIAKIPAHSHTEIGCIARNVNEKTGSQKLRLPNAVLAHGAVKLHADIEIYMPLSYIKSRFKKQMPPSGLTKRVL